MAMSWRTGTLFAAGLLVGAAVGGYAVMHARDKAVWQDNGPAHTMGNAAAQAAATPDAAPPAQVAASAPVVTAAAAAQQCDASPVIARGAEDGKESLQSAPRTASASEVSSLLLTGKEAAASGRMRDAEIAFLNACRNAEVVSGKDAPTSLADAMYQLGRHYANVAPAGGKAKGEMLQRSQRLLQAALQAYQAHYGASHEKVRFAQQSLATAQKLAGGATVAPLPPVATAKPQAVPAPAPAVASAKQEALKQEALKQEAAKQEAAKQELAKQELAKQEAAKQVAARQEAAKQELAKQELAKQEAAKQELAKQALARQQAAKQDVVKAPPTAVVAQRPAPAPAAPAAKPEPVPPKVADKPEAPAVARARTRPSFDCDKAHSTVEKIICADDDLARQDRELGRLHARAEAAAPDRAAFRRQNDAEWQRRERDCRDVDCVRRWYAQRHAQLEALQPGSAQVREASRPAPRAASPAPTTEARVAEPVRQRAESRPAAAEPAPEPTPRVAQRRIQRPPEPAREASDELPEPPPMPPGTAMGAPTAEGSPGDVR